MMDPADVLRDMTEYVVTRWYRPPELLLSSTAYTKSIDMWSVGCIFAELLCRKSIFPGKNHVDQLNLITSIVGTPTAEELSIVTNEQAVKFMKSMPFKPRVNLASRFPNCSQTGIQLLEMMLQFDPRKRIGVVDCLQHPYLATYHDPTNEPVASEIFIADFEDIVMTKGKLRELVWREIVNFHPSLRNLNISPEKGPPNAKRQRAEPKVGSVVSAVTPPAGARPVPPQGIHHAGKEMGPHVGKAGITTQGDWVQTKGEARPYGQ